MHQGEQPGGVSPAQLSSQEDGLERIRPREYSPPAQGDFSHACTMRPTLSPVLVFLYSSFSPGLLLQLQEGPYLEEGRQDVFVATENLH